MKNVNQMIDSVVLSCCNIFMPDVFLFVLLFDCGYSWYLCYWFLLKCYFIYIHKTSFIFSFSYFGPLKPVLVLACYFAEASLSFSLVILDLKN